MVLNLDNFIVNKTGYWTFLTRQVLGNIFDKTGSSEPLSVQIAHQSETVQKIWQSVQKVKGICYAIGSGREHQKLRNCDRST